MNKQYTQLEFINLLLTYIDELSNSQNIKLHYHIEYTFNGIDFNLYCNKRKLTLFINEYTNNNLELIYLFIQETANNTIDINYIQLLPSYKYYFELILLYIDKLFSKNKF